MTGSGSYREVLSVTGLPALLAAATLSRFAGRIFSLAIVLYGLHRFASPELAGWLSFAATAPGLIVSPVAGVLLDRFGSAWGIAVDLATSAALVTAIVAADQFGAATPAMLILLVTLFSLTSPLSAAGVRTLLPRLVPLAARDRTNALDTAIFTIADLGGPALAGSVFAWLGAAPAFAVIAALFAAAAVCALGIRAMPVSPTDGPMLRQIAASMGIVLRQPTLRGLIVSYGLYQVAWGILTILVPVAVGLAVPVGSADWVVGLLWAGAGMAGGFGALLAGALRTAGRERLVMAGGMGLTALAAWPVPAGFGLPGFGLPVFGLAGLAAGLLLASFAAGPVDVGLLTLRQRRTDPAQLGRVLSVSISLNVAGFPIGAALAGMLLTWSLPATFAAACAAATLGALAVGLVPREPRQSSVVDPGR
jgi:predicted MFS family arabinose efflux permease